MESKSGLAVRRHLVYSFGPFQLDAAAKVLLRNGEPVRLTRKAVETLLVLVQAAGQVVTREEIFAAVWPDRVVDEANLAQNIAVIRKALGAAKGDPGYIETFPGRGYRLVGPVTVVESAPQTPLATAPEPRLRRRAAWPAAVAVVAVVALAVVWLLSREQPPPGGGELPHRTPVARQAGKEYQPAISPDGNRVAYVWEKPEDGRASVWVRDGLQAPPRRVGNQAANAGSPAWSPDGRRLAYLSFHGSTGGLVIHELEGGGERILCPVFPSRYGLAWRHMDWSPDGRWLAVNDAESSHEAFGLFLISEATGQRKRLTHTESFYIGDVDPRFSPDGRHLSFIRVFHRAHQELFVMPVEGGEPRQLTFDGKQISGQDWTPDGKEIVFGSDRAGEFRLWRLPAAARPGTQPVATAIYGDFPIQLALARRASVLIYSVLQHDLNVWRLDLTRAREPEGWRRIIASPGQDASPQYSPDGRRICFRSDRSGEEQLWVSDAEGNNAIQITRGAQWPSVGRWSPDGRAIVFNNARSGEIHLAREDGRGSWQVHSTGLTGYHPVFSLDGEQIYAGTMSALVRIPTHGGAPEGLAAERGISLDVSRDGRYVYFVREATDTVLRRADTRTGKIERVLEGLLPYCSSCWALAERGIYYLGSTEPAGGRQALFFHDFAGGRSRPVLDYPEPLSPIGSGPFSLSPDGRFLLCVRLDPSNADVFRVEPFR